jgi:DNA-binding NtrC family response regulator
VAFCAAARRAAGAGTAVAIAGEDGSGRLAVARALHDLAGRAHFAVVDAASALADGRPAWLRRLRELLADADTTLVVRHLERCDDALAAAAAAEIDAAPAAGPRLVATVDPAMVSDAVRPLLDRFCVRLVVPPLRDRREDTELLILSLLERHGASPRLRFHPQAMAALRAADFPGNVRGLEAVVAGIARTRRSGDVLAGDLPELNQAGPAHLTPMERAERDAIVKALHDANHNKAAAAAALGISRPTLYRKMSIYDIGA